MLSQFKRKFRRVPEFFARIFMRLGVSPNGVTVLGLALTLATCVFYMWSGNTLLTVFLFTLWGVLDLVDGVLARMTNQVSKSGAYLDAFGDRVWELSVYFALAWVSGHWVLLFLLLGGSFLVSYAKARAALEIPIVNDQWPDLMERFERLIGLGLGTVLWGLFPRASFFGHDFLYWALLLLNLAVYGTVVQRFFRALRLIRSAK